MQHTVTKMTWKALTTAEPKLAQLRALARQVKDSGGKSFCANTQWYQRFKPELLWLVGWQRHDGPAILQTAIAYDMAYETIYNELPDCRNCQCL